MTQKTHNDIHKELLDLRNFVYLCWRHLDLPAPTPAQYSICEYLQHGPKRRMVQAFRGIGKSYLTATYVCWRLLINPNERILVISANQDRATSFSVFVKRLIAEMPLLQHLQPRDGQRTSNIAFDVGAAENAQAPSVKSVGITGQLTGSRATLIVADDVEVPSNSATVAHREKLSEAVKEFDAILSPNGEILYLGTPQNEESIYNKRLVERGYEIRVWPARVPTPIQAAKYGDTLSSFILDLMKTEKAGASTDPLRFSDLDLSERELSYGRSGFALQFLLDTRLSDAERFPLRSSDFSVLACGGDLGPVKVSWASSPELVDNSLPVLGFQTDRWVRPMFVSPEFAEWDGAVMSVDPSGRGQDELAYSIVKSLSGNLFLAECRGLTGGYGRENLLKLAHACKRHKVKKVIVESNMGDGMMLALMIPVFRDVYDVSFEEVRHNVQKERRIIDTLEPVMNQHRLLVDPTVIKTDADNYNDHPGEKASYYSLFFQLTHITKDKGSLVRDDRLDSFAMAVAYWVEQMGKDDKLARAEHRSSIMDRELESFYETIGLPGALQGGSSFIQNRGLRRA